MRKRPDQTGPAIGRGAFAELLAPIRPQLDRLHEFLLGQIGQFEPEISEMVQYCLETPGKRIRPTLVFFTGCPGAQPASEELLRAGAVVELVHLATLVHDDILDDAPLRHSRRSVFARYGSSAAVLLGDAIFAHALKLAADFPTVDVCRKVSEATRRVCAGEIVQTLRRGTLDTDLQRYFRVIDLKTAELFATSCDLGASLSGQSDEAIQAAAAFGRALGMAYQVYDDVTDLFETEAAMGKTLGTDLAHGKATLPVILHLEALDPPEREHVESLWGRSPEEAAQVIVDAMEPTGLLARVAPYFEHRLGEAETAVEGFSRAGGDATGLRQLRDAIKAKFDGLSLRPREEPT